MFNWVKARSECSLERVFLVLSEVVASDVKARQGLHDGAEYDHTRRDHKIIVSRTRDFGGGIKEAEGVVFERIKGSITVAAVDPKGNEVPLFAATPSLAPDGDCKLEVNGDSLELWQVSRKALEPLFFE